MKNLGKSILPFRFMMRLNLSIDIDAPPLQIFRGLTEPSLVKKWLFGTDLSSDWKVGSPLFFRGSFQGITYEDLGTICAYEPGEIFQYTYWSSFSNVPDTKENRHLITFTISPSDHKSTLHLAHENIPSSQAKDDALKNWEMILPQLKHCIEELV